MAICDETVQAIDSNIKEIENRRKEEKIAEIRTEFDNLITPDFADFITFEDIYNDKWANSTYKLGDAFSEVASAIETVKTDLFTIRSLGSEFEPSLLDEYARSHDLRSVIAKDNSLKARKKPKKNERQWKYRTPLLKAKTSQKPNLNP